MEESEPDEKAQTSASKKLERRNKKIKREFGIGKMVLLCNPTPPKLDIHFHGSFRILLILPNSNRITIGDEEVGLKFTRKPHFVRRRVECEGNRTYRAIA